MNKKIFFPFFPLLLAAQSHSAEIGISGTITTGHIPDAYAPTANYNGSVGAFSIASVLGSRANPDLSDSALVIIQKISGYTGTNINTPFYSSVIKTSNLSYTRAAGAYFECEDDAGWNGIGLVNFCEGIRSISTLKRGTHLGSAYGMVSAAGEDINDTTHTYLISYEAWIGNNSKDASRIFNKDNYEAGYVVTNGGSKIAAAGFVINPYSTSKVQKGFYVPDGPNVISESAFQSDSSSDWGLNLERAKIGYAAIGLPNNSPIRIMNGAGDGDLAALAVWADNSLHLGDDSGFTQTVIGSRLILSNLPTSCNNLPTGTLINLLGGIHACP